MPVPAQFAANRRRPVPARCHSARASADAAARAPDSSNRDRWRTDFSAAARASSTICCIALQVGDPQRRQAMLLGAEQIARPAQCEIELGQFEAVGRRRKRIEPRAGLLRHFARRRARRRNRDARRGRRGPAIGAAVPSQIARPSRRPSRTHSARRRRLRSPTSTRAPACAPARKSAIAASFSGGVIRPCISRRGSPPARRW